MNQLNLSTPTIISSAWLPFGRSDLEALNRFVGAHKRYSAPTEFGSRGEITDLTKGTIQMNQHGIFLIPVDSEPTGFLKAHVAKSINNSNYFGLSIYKSGLTGLGIKINDTMSAEELKIVSGKLANSYSDYVFPVLTDVQQSLVAGIYNEKKICDVRNKIHTYSITIGKLIETENLATSEILKKYQSDIEMITDWVVFHTNYNHCHVFIGMAGCLIIGEPNEETMQLINLLIFTQVCQKTAQRLHSHLWSLRRQLQVIRHELQKGSYIDLKNSHANICQINDILALTEIFDNKLRYETSDLQKHFMERQISQNCALTSFVSERLSHETEKAENRSTTILQLTSEVSVINDEMENKLELIMTKDNMQLNLVLLILTVISAFSIAEIMNFSFEQWGLVALFIVPFSLFVLIYLRKMIKEYRFSLMKRNTDKSNKSK
jgi:cytochrome c oxidase subunit IV